jgi:hypothetical protein
LLALLLPAAAAAWVVLPDLPGWAGGLGAVVLLLLSTPLWLLGLSRHAVLAAGQHNVWKAWRQSSRASGRHGVKALVIVACRGVLLLFAAVNLHLFGQFALWAAEALGGFDVALPRLLCSLGNPVYVIALVALAWWLLTPYFEAVNYLFFVDARTRYEGLDLWYRVQQDFPVVGRSQAVAVLLAVAAALWPVPAQADERLDAVRGARQDIARITREVKEANPYPGSGRWVEPLRAVGRRLDLNGTTARGPFRWYFRSIENFAGRDQAGALETLDGIAARLAALEDSLARPARAAAQGGADGTPSKEHIKGLVPRGTGEAVAKKPAAEKAKPKEPPVKQDDDVVHARPPDHGGPAVLRPVALGGLANALIVILLGLLVAVIVVGVVLGVRAWLQSRPVATTQREGLRDTSADDMLEEPDRQNVATLWHRSDELARAGRFLDAVRTLYLAVLALLHQAALIRYERTRTNGEYADQLRPRDTLHGPFVRLTGLFEVKWYGDRACEEADYATCRGLAEDIRRSSAGSQDRGERG